MNTERRLRPERPLSGVGIGWRPEISGVIADLPELGFVEVVAESLPSQVDDALWPGLQKLLGKGVPAIPHGIGLSLGGAELVEAARVSHLAQCARRLDAPLVSEHIAFVRSGGVEAGHLMPVPRTFEALDALTRNIRIAQDELPVPLAVENIAALFEWPGAQLSESEFLAELVERTGVFLLIDVANLYANARNSGRDAVIELNRLPIERLAYCHVAGGDEVDGFYHDTHTHPVPEAVLELVTLLAERSLQAGRAVPGFMLERDGHYPPAAEIMDEFLTIRRAVQRCRAMRAPFTAAVLP